MSAVAAVRKGKSHSTVSGLTVVELLDRCAGRPVDAVAWQEFVRRFDSTIRSSVCRVLSLQTESASSFDRTPDRSLMGELVDGVYRRLVENQCEALKLLDPSLVRSFDNYLLMITVTVVR